jgi:hypothetical protein
LTKCSPSFPWPWLVRGGRVMEFVHDPCGRVWFVLQISTFLHWSR